MEPLEQLADQGAQAIHAAFLAYRAEFDAITRRARARFEQRDWRGMQDDALERLELYKKIVDRVVAEMHAGLGARFKHKAIWAQMKGCYSRCIAGHGDFEIAETFFNSITRRIFATAASIPAWSAPSDLLGVSFWTQLQARHRAGDVVDIFPYKQSRRLQPS